MKVVGGLEVPGRGGAEIGAFVTEICPGGVVDTHGEVQEGEKMKKSQSMDGSDAQSYPIIQVTKCSNGTGSGCAENHLKKCRASSHPPAARWKLSSAGKT